MSAHHGDPAEADAALPAVESSAGRSEVTARAVTLVAERKPQAEALGTRLADLVADPDAFAAALADRALASWRTRSTSRASAGSRRGSAGSTACVGR